MNNLSLPDGFSWAQNIQLGTPEVYQLSVGAWPRFLLEDSDIPDPLLKFQMTAQDFKERFKVYGIRHTESGKLVAFIQAVLVEIDTSKKELPNLGWRFSIQNASQRSVKNTVSLIEASIDSHFRGHGLSKFLINKVKQEAVSLGFNSVIAPVRPTLKTQFPKESIEDYCARKTSDGRIFDPWIRTHVEAGAELCNICYDSVCITASLTWWREKTGLLLSDSGTHLIEGALMPLEVSIEKKLAVYREPNVWVRYAL
ncbi:MAG: hypothetical protein ACXVAX_09310 [Pseudobdellovibrio sp.]